MLLFEIAGIATLTHVTSLPQAMDLEGDLFRWCDLDYEARSRPLSYAIGCRRL